MPTSSPPPLQHALALLLKGGESAERGARVVFDNLWPRFVRHFLYKGQSQALAEEIASEALLKIFRGVHAVREAEAFEGWAWAVAKNMLLSTVRQNQADNSHEAHLEEDEWATLFDHLPSDAHGDWITNRCLQAQIEQFAAEHPERAYCLERVVLDGWDLDQLAAYLGRTYQASKEYLSQCRKRINEYLRQCLE